jgi:hypothetical protein
LDALDVPFSEIMSRPPRLGMKNDEKNGHFGSTVIPNGNFGAKRFV